jgi:hypothetical protein
MGRPRVVYRWQMGPARLLCAVLARAALRQHDTSASSLISYRSRLSGRSPLFAALALALALCGCSGSHVIDQYAADYRETVAAAGDAQLLLNILRAKDNLPIHFYDLSNIHGSIQLTAGATASVPVPLINAVTPSLLSPSIGAQSSPTFDLGTTDTQEFTRGLLSPLDPRVVKTLFDEGVDPRIMMLLFFSKYTDPHRRVLLNTMACDPANPGHHPELGCYNQVYDYLSEIDRLLAFADAQAGVKSPLQAKLMANTFVALRPIGGALAGEWNLKDNFDQLSKLDTSQYKLIGKQLYRVSGLRLAICYEGARKKLHSLIPSQYPDAACTQNQIVDHQPMADENVGLSLRSTYDIIEFLGQVLRFQQEKGENNCLTLSKYERFCDTGEVLFQVNAPVGTPVIATRYGGASYALYDRGCDRNHQTPCDYSIQVLAILELLINENKAAKDIIATPRVQFVP